MPCWDNNNKKSEDMNGKGSYVQIRKEFQMKEQIENKLLKTVSFPCRMAYLFFFPMAS